MTVTIKPQGKYGDGMFGTKYSYVETDLKNKNSKPKKDLNP